MVYLQHHTSSLPSCPLLKKMAPPRPVPSGAPTHFLCLPLVTAASRPGLAAGVAAFAADVTSPPERGGFGWPIEAVRPLGTLHLTLGVMSLNGGGAAAEASGGGGKKDLAGAVALLRSLKVRELLAEVAAEAGRGGGGRPAGDDRLRPAGEGRGEAARDGMRRSSGDGRGGPARVDRGLSPRGDMGGPASNEGRGSSRDGRRDIARDDRLSPARESKGQSAGDQRRGSSSDSRRISGQGGGGGTVGRERTPALVPELRVTLRGLRSMQAGDVARSTVLYAVPSDVRPSTSPAAADPTLPPPPLLYPFALRLRTAFEAAGFMAAEARGLTLHATVVNASFARGVHVRDSLREGGGRGGHGRKRGDRVVLDARAALDRYGGGEEEEQDGGGDGGAAIWVWERGGAAGGGVGGGAAATGREGFRIEKVAICKMGAKERDNGEVEYEVVAEVDI